ncbi:oligosaccharide flippase family protein [Patescibacteria group bacterium]|nr:oligosaccharide flippase family protein [Patescibacteria group bacterium]MBU1921659.1 oligosaccharide flippase family protein [Patescibacteria group bacterium]
MSLTHKIAWNTIVQIVGKIISTIIGLITIALMARYLGREGFGGYTTIIAFLQIFGILVDFGLTLMTVQMISERADDRKRNDKILSNIFTLRLISAVTFLGIAPLVAMFFPYPAVVKLGIALTSLSFLFISLNQLLTGVFQKHLRMDKITLSEILGRVGLLAAVALFIFLGKGLLWIMAAVVLGSFINFVFNWFFARSYASIKLAFNWPVWREAIGRSWPIGISIAFNLLYFKADTVILSIFRSQAEVGLYGAPYRVLEVLITFPFMFVGVLMPFFARWLKEKKHDDFKKLAQQGFDFMAIIAWPMVFGALVLATPVMVFVAGNEFAESGPILKILILATAVIYLSVLFSHIIVALNKQRKMILGYVATAVVALILYFFLIPAYGMYAAAWITVFSEAMIAAVTFIVAYLTLKWRPSFGISNRALFSAILMAALIYLLSAYLANVLVLIAVGALIYFIMLYILGGIPKQLVSEILKLRRNA